MALRYCRRDKTCFIDEYVVREGGIKGLVLLITGTENTKYKVCEALNILIGMRNEYAYEIEKEGGIEPLIGITLAKDGQAKNNSSTNSRNNGRF